MTKLGNPAPDGWKGLAYGATTKPYSKARPHRGQDWGWFIGTPYTSKRIYAPAAGTVTKVVDGYDQGKYENGGWGNYVEITIAPGVVWRACHFNRETIAVKKGQKVKEGTYLGPMGQSGDTNGPHLHEELWINGARVNPNTYRAPGGKHLPGTPSGSGGGDDPKPFPEPEEEVPVINKKTFIETTLTTGKVPLRPTASTVSVESGPADLTNIVLSFRGVAEGAFGTSDKSFSPVVQIDPVVDTVSGSTTTSASLGIHEVKITADTTFEQVSIPAVSLKKNQHLRIRVQQYGATKFTVDPRTSVTYVTFK